MAREIQKEEQKHGDKNTEKDMLNEIAKKRSLQRNTLHDWLNRGNSRNTGGLQ